MKTKDTVLTVMLTIAILMVLSFIAVPGLYASLSDVLPLWVRTVISLGVVSLPLMVVLAIIVSVWRRIFGRSAATR